MTAYRNDVTQAKAVEAPADAFSSNDKRRLVEHPVRTV